MKNQNQIQQFQSEEFGKIEVLMIGDKPYFPATDCAKILGYSNPRKAILDHCKGVTKCDSLTGGGAQSKNYIPEGDLYRLIIRSKLPSAERFEKLVFDEILPTIRKHGAYATADTLEELLRNPEFGRKLLHKLGEERDKNEQLQEIVEDMAPKALYCDLVLKSDTTIPVNLIAKDYGMSATSFNRLLHKLSVQYPLGGTWLLYQKFAEQGYTQTYTYYTVSGGTLLHTKWTEKGRKFLYEFLAYYGIMPVSGINCAELEHDGPFSCDKFPA